MDVLSQGRFRVLNEPRGFIRIIQWFLAIIAFATCCSYTGKNLQIISIKIYSTYI